MQLGLDVDFNAPRVSRAVVAAGLVALGLVGSWMAWQGAQPTPVQDVLPASTLEPAPVDRGLTQAQIVARDTALPWGRLFDALESAGEYKVVLLSLEPSTATASVLLDAEAPDAMAMAAYLDHLDRFGVTQPSLVRYQPMGSEGAVKLRFLANAAWYRAADPSVPRQDAIPLLLPRRAEVPALAADLLAAAQTAGLTVRSVDQEWANEAGRAPFATLVFDVQGAYGAAREFVNQAVQLRPGIALRQFSLRTGAPRPEGALPGPAPLQGRIELRVHVGAPA